MVGVTSASLALTTSNIKGAKGCRHLLAALCYFIKA